MFSSPVVSGRHAFLGVTHASGTYSPFALSLLLSSLVPKERGVTSHLRLSVPRSLDLCTLSSCGSVSPPLQEETSLMMAE